MKKSFYAFSAVDSQDEAVLNIYDEIGFWGTSAKDFYASLKGIKASKIKVHINSPGGNVVDGYAIYNMLRAHDADIEVHVDGIAASIASVVAMAGDKIIMPENALMFIHSPWLQAAGNADELRKMASDLDKLQEGILSIYMARTKRDKPSIMKMMEEETLLTAKEAKEKCFCDEVVPELRAAAKFNYEDHFDKAVLERMAKSIPSVTPTGGQREQPKDTMTPEEQAALNAAKSRVATLEADNALLTQSAKNAEAVARQNATTEAKNAEKLRKDGIKALAAKYNKDGDLDSITVEALAGETTVDQFKDKVMDAVNERPAKAAIKPGDDTTKGENDFAKKYEACKTFAERQKLIRDNKAEAKKHLATHR